MTSISIDTVHHAQRQWSEELHKIREQLGLSRNDLASMMGYTNLSKGSSRIASWEKAETMPVGWQRKRLAQALPFGSLSEGLATYDEASKQLRAWRAYLEQTDHHARVQLWKFLARHHERLQAHHDEILSNPAWAGAVVPGAVCGMANMGGHALTLGTLVTGWLQGFLRHEDGLIFQLTGSPLSGRHTLTGIRHQQQQSWQHHHGWMTSAIPARQHARFPPSWVSPLEVLAQLGAEVPSIRITRLMDERVYPWNPNEPLPLGNDGEGIVDVSFRGVGLESYILNSTYWVSTGVISRGPQCAEYTCELPVPATVVHTLASA